MRGFLVLFSLLFLITLSAATLADYGNAPDPPYPTTEAHNGAHNLDVSHEWLGNTVDLEAGPETVMDADDDGVVFIGFNQIEVEVTVANRTNTLHPYDSAHLLYLNVWEDIPGDGSWNDSGDWQVQNYPIDVSTWDAGANQSWYYFNVPPAAGWVRVVLSYNQTAPLGSAGTGTFSFGETEDYPPINSSGVPYCGDGAVEGAEQCDGGTPWNAALANLQCPPDQACGLDCLCNGPPRNRTIITPTPISCQGNSKAPIGNPYLNAKAKNPAVLCRDDCPPGDSCDPGSCLCYPTITPKVISCTANSRQKALTGRNEYSNAVQFSGGLFASLYQCAPDCPKDYKCDPSSCLCKPTVIYTPHSCDASKGEYVSKSDCEAACKTVIGGTCVPPQQAGFSYSDPGCWKCVPGIVTVTNISIAPNLTLSDNGTISTLSSSPLIGDFLDMLKDTIVQRKTPPTADQIPIQIIQLDLQSVCPIKVTYAGGVSVSGPVLAAGGGTGAGIGGGIGGNTNGGGSFGGGGGNKSAGNGSAGNSSATGLGSQIQIYVGKFGCNANYPPGSGTTFWPYVNGTFVRNVTINKNGSIVPANATPQIIITTDPETLYSILHSPNPLQAASNAYANKQILLSYNNNFNKLAFDTFLNTYLPQPKPVVTIGSIGSVMIAGTGNDLLSGTGVQVSGPYATSPTGQNYISSPGNWEPIVDGNGAPAAYYPPDSQQSMSYDQNELSPNAGAVNDPPNAPPTNPADQGMIDGNNNPAYGPGGLGPCTGGYDAADTGGSVDIGE